LRRGRDASYLAPPAQIRTCGFPAYGSHLGYRRQRFAVCEPAPLTHSCGSESGACFADPHSPWSPPLARGRDGEAERLGGLEVDNKLELGWLYDWKRSRADCLAMRRSACLPAGRPCRPARGQPLSLATSFKRRRSLRCWGSQIAVEWQDEIAAFPRHAAFARCLPIAQPIPRLRPACLPHEHPGGLKATGTIERRMRDGDQPPPKRKKIRRRRRRDNHDDD
jgi:hypothetical protein